ncbi:MAG: hypothetical protein ABIJ27_02195 [Candidatus Omnitrophota bacterium]
MSIFAKFPDTLLLRKVEEDFNVPVSALHRIMGDFVGEMSAGLEGRESSLKMLPAYVDRASGSETGTYFAIDLGGTNLRVLETELQGNGRIAESIVKNFTLNKNLITGSGEAFFYFIADCIREILIERGKSLDQPLDIGFTFSFPLDQSRIDSGVLLRWTKGFSIGGILGNDVVLLMNEALKKRGLNAVRVVSLANDTVGTLVAKSYEDPRCDIGVILGTGTNACYTESIESIKKASGLSSPSGKMIVNTEWGNFNKIRMNSYDRLVDDASTNPGEQIMEKQVSGMYLGEVARLTMRDLITNKELFGGVTSDYFEKEDVFKTELVSKIESFSIEDVPGLSSLLSTMGIGTPSIKDAIITRRICQIVSTRAARISASMIAGVVIKLDPELAHDHTVAVDGALFEKHPKFAGIITSTLGEIFEKKAFKLNLSLTKDGSGKGSAIIAAITANAK